MVCSRCESPVVRFAVPDSYREYAPSEASTATICTRCLRVRPRSETDGTSRSERADVTAVSEAFPTRQKPAVGIALALELCTSLARNRDRLEALLADLEQAGTDPLLTLERLCRDPTIEPETDLERRVHQLEQLLY
ncbi:DUF6276 family protein [Halostagnicola kamekurae]|uniref:Uncharacterized protein n=1 Tax=Halostagnicola kamekurae TaxID=619731 RepID=A0A1I6PRS7_9EURY|nr:DUF6276 family protein [Halostagnicola kamekurae]SFS42922.1 hypothetical protein SAMN04488556_0746 [Halostagnicola kamekurae]